MNKYYVLAGILALVLMTNAFHEAGHAFTAWWCGDRRPEIRRRMSLNPIRHMHWLYTLVVPAVSYWFFGWPLGGALPVMVDQDAVGPRKMALVGLAGSVGNLLCAALIAVGGAFAMSRDWIDQVDTVRDPGYVVVSRGLWYSLFIIVINLIPVPPADGSRVVGAFLPDRVRRAYFALAPIGVVLVFGVALWATGFLYEYMPSLGRGFAREFAAGQEWTRERLFDLADYFGA